MSSIISNLGFFIKWVDFALTQKIKQNPINIIIKEAKYLHFKDISNSKISSN